MSAPPTSSPFGSPGDWIVLFDGSSTEALRGYGRDEFPADRWVVDDGALRAIPGLGVDLVSRETYADFELEFEWKVAPGGNSGVIDRVAETGDPAWATGPEYQVLDDEAHPDGRDPRASAGALYGLRAPGPTKRLEPVGGFNRGRIVVRDGHVEHWLNGELVVEYEWDGAEIRAEIDRSKFAGLAGFMRQASGHIAFQHHGEEAWLRAMRTARSTARPASHGSAPPATGRPAPPATLVSWPNAIRTTCSACSAAPARLRSRPPGAVLPASTTPT